MLLFLTNQSTHIWWLFCIEFAPQTLDEAMSRVMQYFTQSEREQVESWPTEADREEAFRRQWSMKEAFVKARGDGLGFQLNRAEFRLDAEGSEGFYQSSDDEDDDDETNANTIDDDTVPSGTDTNEEEDDPSCASLTSLQNMYEQESDVGWEQQLDLQLLKSEQQQQQEESEHRQQRKRLALKKTWSTTSLSSNGRNFPSPGSAANSTENNCCNGGLKRSASMRSAGGLRRTSSTHSVIQDGESKPTWALRTQPLGDSHIVSVAMGPPQDVVDSHGVFKSSLTHVDDNQPVEEWREQYLMHERPPFEVVTIGDVLPERLKAKYAEAGGELY